MQVPFAVQTTEMRSPVVSPQRLVNFYAEQSPPDAKSFVTIYGTPGLKPFGSVAGGAFRGSHVMDEILYAVMGSQLYSVDASGVFVALGVIPGSNPVVMAENGIQLMIVTRPDAYVFTVADGVVQVTDPDFPGAGSVTFLDGYFIFTRPNTGQFFLSELFDGLSYDALDFATAEGESDNLVTLIAEKRQLFLFGERSTEVWFNSGDAVFPFERVPGGFIERGCGALDSVAKDDNSVFWLGDDLLVYRAAGLTPEAVSTNAFGVAVEGYSNPENATAFFHTIGRHKFYVLGFDDDAWALDTSNGTWHERASHGRGSYRAVSGVQAYGKTIVGDRYSSALHEIDPETFTDAGDPLVSTAVSVSLGDGVNFAVMRSFELHIEAGVGLVNGDDPQVRMRFSNDDGRTWSGEYWRSMGKMGARLRRALWNRLGQYKSRTFEVSISDPVKRVIVTAQAF